MPTPRMTFREWQQLTPADAAREFHRRVGTLLPAAQQRAVLAWLPPQPQLTEAFARADRTGPLGGVPYLLKDLFPLAGVPTFAGSTFLPEVEPPSATDAAIVHALQAAGAVCAGKTHLHEFAYGITGENPHYGDCEHPRFPGRTSGGSSSGSAAAVAAGLVPFAIGTDTGGSVRVPAAFCGLFGYRLNPGHAFGADAFPLARSLDSAGWFAANAPDLLSVTDALSPLAPVPRPPRGCFLELPGLDRDVAGAFRVTAARLAPPADPDTRTALLHGFRDSLLIYGDLVAAEAWTVHQSWADRYRDRYDPAVWQRLQRGRTLPRADADRALIGLTAARFLWAKYFLAFDFLILPATPCAALTKVDCTPAHRRRLLSLTAPASLGGLPVLTLPFPLASGLTSGLQLIVNHPRSPAIRWALEQVIAPASRA